MQTKQISNKTDLKRKDKYIALSNLIRNYLELLTPETMKLLGSTNSKITKNENTEIVPKLEFTEVLLIRSNIVNNNCQRNLRVFYTFVPNISFDQLLDILPKNFIF